MQLKNIMVAFNGTDRAVQALRFAATLANQHNSFVTAVMAHSSYEMINSRSAWMPAEARQIIEHANSEILTQIKQRFEQLKPELKLEERLLFQSISGRVDVVLSEVARGFDVVIAATRLETDEAHVSFHPDRIALLSGRPVIILPNSQCSFKTTQQAAVIWDGTRSSSRALWDSLLLPNKDSEVTLLTIQGKKLVRPIDEIITQLQRHHIKAKHVEIASRSKDADSYLDYCQTENPDLLITGAYEHSKFREDLLGGLTSDILAKINVPVLISH